MVVIFSRALSRIARRALGCDGRAASSHPADQRSTKTRARKHGFADVFDIERAPEVDAIVETRRIPAAQSAIV